MKNAKESIFVIEVSLTVEKKRDYQGSQQPHLPYYLTKPLMFNDIQKSWPQKTPRGEESNTLLSQDGKSKSSAALGSESSWEEAGSMALLHNCGYNQPWI